MSNSKTYTHCQHYRILKNHDFLAVGLRGDKLLKFKEMVDKISLMVDYHEQNSNNSVNITSQLKDMISVIEDCTGQDGLMKTFKKLAIIHLFVRKAACSDYFNEDFARACVEEVERVQDKDLKALTKDKGWGMTEIRQIFKELSHKTSSPESIQHQASKGALKEIVNKIYLPFCLYLLKVIQDRQIYSQIMQKSVNPNQFLIWKMANLSRQLGSLIRELNRICRYFRKQLSGIYCHFIYLISLDISQYYDSLRIQVRSKCSDWREIISSLQAMKLQDCNGYSLKKEALLRDTSFVQLKRSIEEISAIREDLVWIYMNKELRYYLKHFKRPTNGIQIEIDPTTNHITYLQAFIDKQASPNMKTYKSRRTSIQKRGSLQTEGKENELGQIFTGLSIGDGQFDEGNQLEPSK